MRKLLLLSIIFTLSLSSCKFIKEKGWFGKDKADTLIVWQVKQDSIRVAREAEVELQRIRMIQQAQIDSLQSIENEQLEYDTRFKFHIIVGSFLTPEYAVDHVDLYNSMGYDATVFQGPEKRFHFVSAEAHESMNRALSRLIAFQDTVEFEAWLYILN